MHASFDPHDELGVPGHASEREIRNAYRRLAAQWHPDRNPNPRAAERMARINRAYRQLCDSGHAPRDNAARAPTPPPPPAGAASARASRAAPAPPRAAPPPAAARQAADPEPPPRAGRAWWDRDWGRSRWEPDGSKPPQTLRHTARIKLEEAAFGCTHRVKGSVADGCEACHGSGRLVSRRSDCKACGGQGRSKAADGSRWIACARCDGDGSDRKACEDCSGTGIATSTRRYQFDVRIPGGMREGQTVMLRGQGQRVVETAGDIELAISIEPHALFTFDEQQRLCCRVPVDLFSQLGGGLVDIPTLEGGTTRLDLALGPAQELQNQGYPNRDGTRGPLRVQTHAITPSRFSRQQARLLQQLAQDLRAGGFAEEPELAAWHRSLVERRAGPAQAAA